MTSRNNHYQLSFADKLERERFGITENHHRHGFRSFFSTPGQNELPYSVRRCTFFSQKQSKNPTFSHISRNSTVEILSVSHFVFLFIIMTCSFCSPLSFHTGVVFSLYNASLFPYGCCFFTVQRLFLSIRVLFFHYTTPLSFHTDVVFSLYNASGGRVGAVDVYQYGKTALHLSIRKARVDRRQCYTCSTGPWRCHGSRKPCQHRTALKTCTRMVCH